MQTSDIKGIQVKKQVECPMCNSFFSISYYRPEKITSSIRYSDGQTDVTSIVNPIPTTHCIFCAFSFSVLLNTHKESKTGCVIKSTDIEKQRMSEPPEGILDGYLNSVRFRRAITPAEEFFIRKHIWWLLNNDKEKSEPLFRQHEQVWQDNLKEILFLIEKTPLDAPLIQAEVLRNLGFFDPCLKLLDNLPANSDSKFVNRLWQECEAGNPDRVIL